MPQDPKIYREYAYLRINGYGPSSVISDRLGIEPDEEWSEGDKWRDSGPNSKRFFTHWVLNSGLKEGDPLNDHISAILMRLHRKRAQLQSLTGEYDVCLVIVSYSLQAFSFELEFELQRKLTDFGIRTWIDAYIYEDTHEIVHDLKNQLTALKKQIDEK